MRPKERRDSGQNDLFRARLDQIANMSHPLTKLARSIDWRFLEERFGAVYSDGSGQPPRLMAGLAMRTLCTYLGRMTRDIVRRIKGMRRWRRYSACL